MASALHPPPLNGTDKRKELFFAAFLMDHEEKQKIRLKKKDIYSNGRKNLVEILIESSKNEIP